MERFLDNETIEAIEREHPNGIPARAIVELFQPLGGRLSEATFRKYVQVGLLPRSRRVGRKGKHQGSQGLYPIAAIRRLNLIRKMMSEGMTLEQIRGSFLCARGEIDELSRLIEGLVERQLEALRGRTLPPEAVQALERELHGLMTDGLALVRRFEQVASVVTSSHPPESRTGSRRRDKEARNE